MKFSEAFEKAKMGIKVRKKSWPKDEWTGAYEEEDSYDGVDEQLLPRHSMEFYRGVFESDSDYMEEDAWEAFNLWPDILAQYRRTGDPSNKIDSKETPPDVKKFFTVKKFAKKNRECGSWPGSESAIWALRVGVPDNGFGKAFVTVGKSVLIDEEKFVEAIRSVQKEN